jgi:hypothetical protein
MPEPAVAPIEHDSSIAPLTVFEAAVRSGELALAAGEFAAARESLTFALAHPQMTDSPELAAHVRLAQVDALIGLAQFIPAKEQLAGLRGQSPFVDDAVDTRAMAIREREHAYGISSCEVKIDVEPRSMARHDGFLAAWNDLRDGFASKADADIPIPTDDHAARERCPECAVDQAGFVSIELDDRRTFALLFEDFDLSVSVLPRAAAHDGA